MTRNPVQDVIGTAYVAMTGYWIGVHQRKPTQAETAELRMLARAAVNAALPALMRAAVREHRAAPQSLAPVFRSTDAGPS